MFDKKTLIILISCITLISTHNLAFDLRSVKYTQGSDYWTVDIPCSGGSGQYSYQFNLPSGWKNQGNKIKIPTSSTTQTNNEYVVRCRVKDNSKGDVLQRSLAFRPFSQGSSASLQVTDHDYFYGNSGLGQFSKSTSSIHGIDVLNRLGALVKSTGNFGLNVGGFSGVNSYSNGYGYSQNTGGYSNNNQYSSSSSSSYGSKSQSSQSGSYGSGSSIYVNLPTISQLQAYISGGDIVEIIQTIQLVVESKIRCQAKSAYLSDFLGRICGAIEVKKYTFQQLKQVATGVIEQINKLTIQIQSIKTQQQSLHIKELSYQLQTLIIQLKAAYDDYNNFNSNYQSYDKQINDLQQQVNQINIKYRDIQQKLNGLKKSVEDIDGQITEYQQRIRTLKVQKESAQKQILESQKFIKQRDQKLNQINSRISTLKNKISNAASQKDKLKQIYVSLEKQVSTVKQSLEINQKKYNQYEQQISSINIEISRIKGQASEIQIKQVSQCIQNLQSAMTQIKQSIDFVAYHCYDATDVQIDHDGNGKNGNYHFDKNQWFGYVNKCYSDLGEQIRNKILSSFKNQVIEISTINVYSDVWKQNYGSCFQKDIEYRARNSKTDKSYSFSSDFSCSSDYGSVQSKSGTIQNISSNQVNIRGDDGRDYTLKLGSCSKFEGQGKQFVPKKDQNIIFKGSKKDNTSYNLHSCTCY